MVLAAVSDRASQCSATLMSNPPCSPTPATPGPLVPGEAGQGSSQGPTNGPATITSSPTEPQKPTQGLPPIVGGCLGWAGTREMSKISLPQATKPAERRPLSPHASLPVPEPIPLPRGAWGVAGGWEGGQRREGTERRRETPRDPQTRRWGQGKRGSYQQDKRTEQGFLAVLPRETSGNKQKKTQI
jgi:hypothetical protein